MSIYPTPYYKTLALEKSIGCVDAPTQNYSPYDLFCLKTRISDKINTLRNSPLQVKFLNIYKDELMKLTIQIFDLQATPANKKSSSNITEESGNQPIFFDEKEEKLIKKWINDIITEYPNHCLISSSNLNSSIQKNKYISSQWIKSVIPYINISDVYNPFITGEGIFVELNSNSDYLNTFNELNEDIIKQLRNMYNDGLVIVKSLDIVRKWNLVALHPEDSESYAYYPKWSDTRFAPNPVDFLLERISGINCLQYLISDNLVHRHFIMSDLYLSGFKSFIHGSYLHVHIDNLSQARTATSIIYNSKSFSNGKIAILHTSRLSWIYLYIEAVNELYTNPHYITYKISNSLYPTKSIVFSTLIPPNKISSVESDRIHNLAIQKLSNYSNLNKSPDFDLHSYIEKIKSVH